ncbi:MAG TPA: carboxymuconolactone decarboxylase family protein [Thermodesulfobacteriota bacterium]|nr:carboxymuconolactone decarboxylase family protein [Thermodesulfobacteriota bacterium]
MVSIKNAKTGQEMVDSWQELVGNGDIEDIKQAFQVYVEKMPDILKNFTNQPLLESLERKALDPKTRELVLVGMLAAMQCGPGLIFHIQGAVHAGATEEEIMEVIYLSCYEQGKVHAAALGQSIAEGLKRAAKMKK